MAHEAQRRSLHRCTSARPLLPLLPSWDRRIRRASQQRQSPSLFPRIRRLAQAALARPPLTTARPPPTCSPLQRSISGEDPPHALMRVHQLLRHLAVDYHRRRAWKDRRQSHETASRVSLHQRLQPLRARRHGKRESTGYLGHRRVSERRRASLRSRLGAAGAGGTAASRPSRSARLVRSRSRIARRALWLARPPLLTRTRAQADDQRRRVKRVNPLDIIQRSLSIPMRRRRVQRPTRLVRRATTPSSPALDLAPLLHPPRLSLPSRRTAWRRSSVPSPKSPLQHHRPSQPMRPPRSLALPAPRRIRRATASAKAASVDPRPQAAPSHPPRPVSQRCLLPATRSLRSRIS